MEIKIKYMCECEKINNCGTVHFATCTLYEGYIPEDSVLKNECSITVEDTIEDIYKNLSSKGQIEYTSGEGIDLINYEFSINNSVATKLWVEGQNYLKEVNTASETVKGISKIAFNDVQEVVQNNVSNVIGRTYGVQYNKNGQLVVNVPWVAGEGTKYSASNGINLNLSDFSPNYGVTVGTIAQGNDIRILNGQTAYSWGNHASAGYLTSVPIATSLVSGKVKLFSDSIQTSSVNSITTDSSRTYGIQFNSLGQLVVNVPWKEGSASTVYQEGVGISLSNNTITNTQPNASHTGEVTGSSSLTITNQAVTNSKLANMPQFTLKGRESNSGTPQDLSVSQVRSILNIKEYVNKMIFLDNSNTTVTLDNAQEITIFVSVNETITIEIPDGEIDGQKINIYGDSRKIDAIIITGSLEPWNAPLTPVNSFTKTTELNYEHLYWSESRGTWLIGFNR